MAVAELYKIKFLCDVESKSHLSIKNSYEGLEVKKECVGHRKDYILGKDMENGYKKTEVELFSSSVKDAKTTPNIYIGGNKIKVNTTPKFLGVTFDR